MVFLDGKVLRGCKWIQGYSPITESSLHVGRRRKDVARYYVWHKGGGKNRGSKIRSSAKIGSWYLKKDWENITMVTTARGVEWLRKMSV